MKILHRYVLKEHLGPLTFALTALTSLLLLQYIGKHFGQLVGKGLPTLVIAEFFGLSVPLTVALTLPMAVLVSTLYAFSRLAAENEITALKASGVSLATVLRPVSGRRVWSHPRDGRVQRSDPPQIESPLERAPARHRADEADVRAPRAGDK